MFAMTPPRDEYDDDDAYVSAPRLAVMPQYRYAEGSNPGVQAIIPPLPEWKDDIDTDPLSPTDLDATPVEAVTTDETSEEEESEPSQETLNYFVHNGYRYDGDIFQLRPPQERSIASRPERVLEHKPPLLSNRQTFNRVYSEGTYNARPSSLRQPRRTSSRFSTSSSIVSDFATDEPPSCPSSPVQMDPGMDQNVKPVTRPPSVRPLSPRGLCRTIEEVKQSASLGEGNQYLRGLLEYSAVPVTQIQGEKPEVLNAWEKRVYLREGKGDELVEEVIVDENIKPRSRGRSYTSFAKNTPYGRGSRGLGRFAEDLGGKKSGFWRNILMSR